MEQHPELDNPALREELEQLLSQLSTGSQEGGGEYEGSIDMDPDSDL